MKSTSAFLVAALLVGVSGAVKLKRIAPVERASLLGDSTPSKSSAIKDASNITPVQRSEVDKEVHKRGIFHGAYGGGLLPYAATLHGTSPPLSLGGYWPKTYAAHYDYSGYAASVPTIATAPFYAHASPGFAHAPTLLKYPHAVAGFHNFKTFAAPTFPYATAFGDVAPFAAVGGPQQALPHHDFTPFVLRPGNAVVSSYNVNYPQYSAKPVVSVPPLQTFNAFGPDPPVQPFHHFAAVQPAQPIQPHLQPLQPIQPHLQPLQPIQPHLQPLQPIQPHLQPVQPIQPHLQPLQPIQPHLQPLQPIQPVLQPLQPLHPGAHVAPVQPFRPVQFHHTTTFVQHPQPALPAIPAFPAAPTFPFIPTVPSVPAVPLHPLAPAPPAFPSVPIAPSIPAIPVQPVQPVRPQPQPQPAQPAQPVFPLGVQPPQRQPQQPPLFGFPIQPASQFPDITPLAGTPTTNTPQTGSADAAPQIPAPAPAPEPEYSEVQPTQEPWRPIVYGPPPAASRPSMTLLPPYTANASPAQGYLPPQSSSTAQLQLLNSGSLFDNLSDAEIEHIINQANLSAQQQHQSQRVYKHEY